MMTQGVGIFDRSSYKIEEPVKKHLSGKSTSFLNPAPDDIQDKFSSVLGDIFHYMDRPKVPVHHELKKSYFMALSKAFLPFDQRKLLEVRKKLKLDDPNLTDEDIDHIFYFKQDWLCSIVPRCAPPPSILYWRVRAVYAAYGNAKSSQGVPLFNDAAWTKANNVLLEILKGYASDPPGMSFYTPRVNSSGQHLHDKYGFVLLNCFRGTNATECVHKQITTTFHNWHQGCEMSDFLLAEFRHRYNQVISFAFSILLYFYVSLSHSRILISIPIYYF